MGEPLVLDIATQEYTRLSPTVYNYGKAAAVSGVYVFNIHVAGGEAMCREAVRGAYEAGTSAEMRREPMPKVIGVTVLTSLDDDDLAVQGLGTKYDDLVRRRTELAKEWGLAGVVCPASKAGGLEKEFGSDLECSFAKDKDGYFCYTHRARSDSYPTIAKIPKSKVKFIESTG